jgi:hypothetical protein
MNTPNESTKLSPADEVAFERVGRRRFLGASSAVAPVVLTILSQPALGTTCFTPSRALSKNTSISQANFVGECSGAKSPQYYLSNLDSWPAFTPQTGFNTIFGGKLLTKLHNGQLVPLSMKQVLNRNGNSDIYTVASYLIAAVLNSRGGASISIKAFDTTRATDIWQDYSSSKGYFEPTAGVYWYAADIVLYLTSNGIVSAT